MSEQSRNTDLTSIEEALGTLTPALGRLDRDHLLFRAGQVSVSRGRWLWPAATGLLATVAASLALSLVLRSSPASIERVVYVNVPAPPSRQEPAQSPADAERTTLVSAGEDSRPWVQTNFSLLENQLLRWGLDALRNPPQPTASSAPPLTIDALLGTTPVARPAPAWFPLEILF
jgi:hypothetical protein